MLKNQLYPYIESYLNEYLYGFTKDQLNIGVANGQIKFENLNLRPDTLNQKMDEKNFPFWLKAGLVSKINIGLGIMNFIGEKPLDVLIEGVNIILNPSYKWIIKNMDSFIIENLNMMKSVYDPNDNNSIDIFTKKINVLDNSIFKKEYIEEIFKDKTRLSSEINKIFKFCYKYFYSNNFLINLTIKNIHIRFEDDQVINYNGNLALGVRLDSLEIILNSEGVQKRDSLKINKLNVYWESPAKILIPSSALTIKIKDGKLDEEYYTNLKKLNFKNFEYSENNKFLIQNFSFYVKFGIKSVNKGKIDIFDKGKEEYKFYLQFISSEINFHFYPDLLSISQNFSKFVNEFTVLEQVQDFKPLKKPYNIKDRTYLEYMDFMNKTTNPKYIKNFTRKKKMLVRDWLFYFYWCQKCKLSLIGKKINPLRLEFSRFYNLCFSYPNELFYNNNNNNNNNNFLEKAENIASSIPKTDENKVGIEDYNPDKINISYISDFTIKGLNINLHPSTQNANLDFISIKINNIDIKIMLSKSKFDLMLNFYSIIIGPNKLSIGEKVFLSSTRKKKEKEQNPSPYNNYNNYEESYYQIINNIEENTGLTGLVNKYNPNYKLKLQIIDEALEKIGRNNKNKSFFNYNSNNNNNNESQININNDIINDNISQRNDINSNDSKYDIDNKSNTKNKGK